MKYSKQVAISIVTALPVCIFFSDDRRRQHAHKKISAAYRVSRLLSTTSAITFDYYVTFKMADIFHKRDNKKRMLRMNIYEDEEQSLLGQIAQSDNSSEIEQLRLKLVENTEKMLSIKKEMSPLHFHSPVFSELHARNALRLRNICEQNKGVYIKLGQHIAMLDHIVPVEYQLTLSSLLSNNPVTPFPSVIRVVEEDLGRELGSIFVKFDQEPIASASLAQVHIAYDKNGNKYAVKVQHEGLLDSSVTDLSVITFLVDIVVPFIFEGFDYRWLTKEINKNLPSELDFSNELRNIQKCKETLQSRFIDTGLVAVPTVYPEFSSARVLTMSFEEGYSVSNRRDFEELGIDGKQVARQIAAVFCDQIYRSGFVHCGETSMLQLCTMQLQ
jgi:predicted unusual protein kinase regulating ubiquinone biosynthesis (AarF/ABC1/UbiB family)